MPVEDVKRLGRSTQGVIVMRLRDGEIVSTLAPVVDVRRRPTADGDPDRSDDVPTEPLERRRRRRAATRSKIATGVRPSLSRIGALCVLQSEGSTPTEGGGRMAYTKQVDVLEPIDLSRAPRQGRALPRPGLPARRHLEDAARLLDEQGADPDQGQEAADLRHGRGRDRDADQAGQGQGPEPRRRDRRRAPLPRGAGGAAPRANGSL